jgi:hypothetical protein
MTAMRRVYAGRGSQTSSGWGMHVTFTDCRSQCGGGFVVDTSLELGSALDLGDLAGDRGRSCVGTVPAESTDQEK